MTVAQVIKSYYGHSKPSTQRQIIVNHCGRRFVSLTRWLPAVVHLPKRSIVIEDDFSQLISTLRARGRRFIIRENARKQRALFVEAA